MLFKTMIRTPASTGLLAMATGALALVAMTGSSHALVLTETNTLNVLIDYTSVTDTINITGGGTVLGLTVTIDFTKCGETFTGPTCTDPGRPYYGEIDFKLKNGATTIDLVQGSNLVGTYAWQTSGPGVRAIVTFDDAAADLVGSTNGGIPEDGTFQPIGSLASFLGYNAAGAWELIMGDKEPPDPLWVTSWTIDITTEDPAPTCCTNEPDPEPEPEPTVVSEPGTLAILGLGIIGLGISRRKRST
jgi:hypothetical protein